MIKNNKKAMKTLVFSLGLVAMLLTSTNLNAQDRGLFGKGKSSTESKYSGNKGGLLRGDVTINDNTGDGGIQNDDFGAPLSSGIAILLAAGAGYAIVRRKRLRKGTALLLACVLLLGFTQCKKEESLEPQDGQVRITLDVNKGNNNGSKVEVAGSKVTFTAGDQILVAYNGKYAGTLTHNGTYFTGGITATKDGEQPLYFYFLGNKSTGTLTEGESTSCTVNISDQTGYPALPVISFSASDQDFDGPGSYTAKLHNKCSLMKFNVTTPSDSPICITGMNNKVMVDFSKAGNDGENNGFTYDKDGESVIKMKGGSGENVVKWVVVLQQDELGVGGEGTAYTEDCEYIGARAAVPAITMDQYLNEDRTMTVNTPGWDGDLSKLTGSSTEAFATARNGMTIYGTLGVNKKVSIAAGAMVTLDNVTINGVDNSSYRWAGLTCLGDATIILADGTINTVKGFYKNNPGIQAAKRDGEGDEYTLTIQGTGTLDARSNGYATGIGGGNGINCGNITINGGTITATGGRHAAGIGCGGYGTSSCGDITINGGTIEATGGARGAGIGGSYNGTCGDITISNGEITAIGGVENHFCAAGIGGGGFNGNCNNITISGGVVTATGASGDTDGAAGIGGGYAGTCGAITISGGVVTATGGDGTSVGGVGIGGGYNRACGDILISGGTVSATGGNKAAGVGAGYYSENGTITIQNTVTRVTATKGENAYNSIGVSVNNRGTCGTVTIGGVVGAISDSPYTYQP